MTTSNMMIFWLLFGFFIIFIGFLSIFTGVAQIVSATDVFFVVQIEDMIFLDQIVSKESVVLSGVIRVMIGFLFIVIGNSFAFRGGFVSSVCHPRMSDIIRRKSFRDL